MEKKFAENEYVQIWTEGNILYSDYKPELTINLPIAVAILELMASLCKEEKYLVLQDMKNLQWIDKQARDLFASHPFTNRMKAWAYHSRKPLHKIMYTIYLTFSDPDVNTAFFKNSEDGLNWLNNLEEKPIP